MSDVVNHPPHYKSGNGLEAIDVIEGFGLGFHLGNVVKYVLRAGRKDEERQDLRKARWYLDRRITTTMQPHSPTPLGYRLCYLATPYTKYPDGLQLAFRRASMIAAELLKRGVRIYSPIAHCHPLSEYGGLNAKDHSIWIPFDESMMDAADCLIVAHMEGWSESYGVKHEIEWFEREGKPIFDLDPKTFDIALRGADREAA